MTIFHSLPTLALFGAAAVLTVWGSLVKKGRILSFFGALLGAFSLVAGLVDGAALGELLALVLALFLLSQVGAPRPPAGGEGAAP